MRESGVGLAPYVLLLPLLLAHEADEVGAGPRLFFLILISAVFFRHRQTGVDGHIFIGFVG